MQYQGFHSKFHVPKVVGQDMLYLFTVEFLEDQRLLLSQPKFTLLQGWMSNIVEIELHAQDLSA